MPQIKILTDDVRDLYSAKEYSDFINTIESDWVEVSVDELQILKRFTESLCIIIIEREIVSPHQTVQHYLDLANEKEQVRLRAERERQERTFLTQLRKRAKTEESEKQLLAKLLEKHGIPERPGMAVPK
ncbi:hypothetical protein D3C87_279140 [compost metagenome]